MKRVIAIFLVLLCLFCLCFSGCNRAEKYRRDCFDIVLSNQKYLTQYIEDGNDALTEELERMGVMERDPYLLIPVFIVKYTGLYDGGVEYGFYYEENDSELDKSMSELDFMVIEHITGHWYYYEWHYG